MDSDVENAINDFNEDGSYIKFVCVNDGLYCTNLDNSGGHVYYLTTVFEQKDHFSDVDNKRAEVARYIQECLCLPSDKDFVEAIDTGGIKECGIDRRHIKIANIILWTDNTHSTKHPREVWYGDIGSQCDAYQQVPIHSLSLQTHQVSPVYGNKKQNCQDLHVYNWENEG